MKRMSITCAAMLLMTLMATTTRAAEKYDPAALAKTIETGLGQLRPVRQPTLSVRRAVVRVPLQEVSADQVAAQQPSVVPRLSA